MPAAAGSCKLRLRSQAKGGPRGKRVKEKKPKEVETSGRERTQTPWTRVHCFWTCVVCPLQSGGSRCGRPWVARSLSPERARQTSGIPPRAHHENGEIIRCQIPWPLSCRKTTCKILERFLYNHKIVAMIFASIAEAGLIPQRILCYSAARRVRNSLNADCRASQHDYEIKPNIIYVMSCLCNYIEDNLKTTHVSGSSTCGFVLLLKGQFHDGCIWALF